MNDLWESGNFFFCNFAYLQVKKSQVNKANMQMDPTFLNSFYRMLKPRARAQSGAGTTGDEASPAPGSYFFKFHKQKGLPMKFNSTSNFVILDLILDPYNYFAQLLFNRGIPV